MQDPDLRALRERREWLDALETAKGGVSTRALVGARAEARAPFRLARLFIFGGLGAGAGLGLFIIASRLIAALKGKNTDSNPIRIQLLQCTVYEPPCRKWFVQCKGIMGNGSIASFSK